MKVRSLLLLGLLQACASCAMVAPESVAEAAAARKSWRTRIVVPNATINEQPVRLVFDTGFSRSAILAPAGTRRLGLKLTAPTPRDVLEHGEYARSLTETARLNLLGQTFRAELAVSLWELTDGDGIIGWPGVRDNPIIVFDPAQRAVRSIDKLPPEVSGWLKLKVRPADELVLDLTLSNGETGSILIDTGGLFGIALAEIRFREWRADHPDAPAMEYRYYMPGKGAGNVTTEQVWADEIKLGALTLTDLPVRPANAFEVANVPNLIASLGLYALERTDLIVDGKNGYAYLRPRPPPGPPYAPFKRVDDKNISEAGREGSGDWTMTGVWQFNGADIYYLSGGVKMYADDFADAGADYDRVLAMDPQNTTAYVQRGCIRQFTGNFAGAISDFTQAIERMPQEAALYQRRALAKDCNGDFTGALADYEKTIELGPANSTYPRIYRAMLQQRLGKASDGFFQSFAGSDNEWSRSVGGFLAKQLDEAALQAAVEKGPAEGLAYRRCFAYYYQGVMRLLAGDKAGARDCFQKSLTAGGPTMDEYWLAHAELARLGADAAR